MGKTKWGESFLKTGLPLEHLTIVTLKSLGWNVRSHIEYERKTENDETEWFELDCEASTFVGNHDTELSLLIECKYNDLSRYWFFLPHEPNRWNFDDRFLNCAPYQTLVEPRAKNLVDLAPCSIWGTVVSKDGKKQKNSVYTALQQVVNGFIPFSLSSMFGYNIDFYNTDEPEKFIPTSTALIPVVVTNATIFRLKPTISDLNDIRKASSPDEIADEIPWTWCYHEPSQSLLDQNLDSIDEYEKREHEIISNFPYVKENMRNFYDRPNWVAIININALSNFAETIRERFKNVQMKTVNEILNIETKEDEN